MKVNGTKPDGYTPEGIPVYIKVARGNGKSLRQLKIYEELLKNGFRPMVNQVESRYKHGIL